jgi:DNA replication protein DnaC
METASKILSQLKTIRQKSESRKQFCNKHQSGFIVTCIECDNEKKTQREKALQTSVLLANSGIKKRFLTANFDSFIAEIESEMNNFQVAKNFAQSFDVMKSRGSYANAW